MWYFKEKMETRYKQLFGGLKHIIIANTNIIRLCENDRINIGSDACFPRLLAKPPASLSLINPSSENRCRQHGILENL